jgi:hypothetical protein
MYIFSYNGTNFVQASSSAGGGISGTGGFGITIGGTAPNQTVTANTTDLSTVYLPKAGGTMTGSLTTFSSVSHDGVVYTCAADPTSSSGFEIGCSLAGDLRWFNNTNRVVALHVSGSGQTSPSNPSAGIAHFPGGSDPFGVTSSLVTMPDTSLFTTNAKTATYQVLAADFASCKVIPVSSGTFTITLVASGSQPPDGQCIYILNYGTGVLTLARSGQNINGAASNLTGTAGSATAPTGWFVHSDGTNYEAQVIGGGGGGTPSGGAGFVQLSDGAGAFTNDTTAKVDTTAHTLLIGGAAGNAASALLGNLSGQGGLWLGANTATPTANNAAVTDNGSTVLQSGAGNVYISFGSSGTHAIAVNGSNGAVQIGGNSFPNQNKTLSVADFNNSVASFWVGGNDLATVNGTSQAVFLPGVSQGSATPIAIGGTSSSFPGVKAFGNAFTTRLATDAVAAFSTLTACASGGEGAIAPISDSTTATWGATITGGGSNHVLAYCNGTNWTVAAK